MARRRYQQGGLRLVEGKWKLEWREDVISSTGEVTRVRRKETIGTEEEYPTERLARREADARLARAGINSLNYKPGRIATLREFSELWERDVLVHQSRSSHPAEKSRLNKHLLPSLGDVPLGHINQQMVQSLVTQLSAKGLSKKSVRNVLITLQTILSTAKEWEYTVSGFRNTVKLPRRRGRTKGRRYSKEEAKRIFEQAPWPYNLVMLTAALTGMRRGELLGLRWCDIDFETSTITVNQTAWQGEIQAAKSEDSERTLPLPDGLARTLKEYRKSWTPNDNDLLWADENGGPIDGDNFRNRILRPLLDKAGIQGRAGLHAFRHMHGTLLNRLTHNAKVVQSQMGHADIATTMDFYVDNLNEDHRKGVEKLEKELALDGADSRPRLRRVK